MYFIIKCTFIIPGLDLGCWWSEHLFYCYKWLHAYFIYFPSIVLFSLWILLHLPCCNLKVIGNCKKWKYSIFKNAIKFWIAIDLWTNCSSGSTKMVLATISFLIDITIRNWNPATSWKLTHLNLNSFKQKHDYTNQSKKLWTFTKFTWIGEKLGISYSLFNFICLEY